MIPTLLIRGINVVTPLSKDIFMPIVKVIEVIASSSKGIDDALQSAVTEASKTIHNIDSIYVKDIKAHVKDGKISSYGLICKISFRLDDNRQKS
jgi:flavin-binding protein dodecin